MFDHLGRPDPALGLAQLSFAALLELGRSGRAWIKLSGADRWAGDAWPHPPADPFAAAALEALTPARCVWGSDWPFLRSPGRMDYGPVRALLDRWAPDPDAQQVIPVNTPVRLFGP